MLITIEGLPGANKAEACAALAAALELPVLDHSNTIALLQSAAHSGDQNLIAVANVVCQLTRLEPHGVTTHSRTQASAYFDLLFSDGSPTPAAQAHRLARAAAPWAEQTRVVVQITPEQSLELDPASGLTLGQLQELKEAENASLATANTIVVAGPCTQNTITEILLQVAPPRAPPAQFL